MPTAIKSPFSGLRFRRTAASLAVACTLLLAAAQIPAGGLSDRTLVVLEATRVVGGLGLLLFWLGWAVSDLVLPDEWKEHELLLLPLIGLCVFVPAAYFLNFFLDMKAATAAMAIGAAPLGLRRLKRGSPVAPWTRDLAVPALAALLLLFVALIPHVIQDSLGLLAQSMDEETYHGLAKYLLTYPAGSGAPGPVAFVSRLLANDYRPQGFGFQYLLAGASAASGVEPFDAYLPTIYMLLSIGVISWHLFYRRVLLLSPNFARIATVLYAVHGLPLWIAAYGYALQTAWIALTPLALTGLALVLLSGGRKAMAITGLVIGTMIATETRVVTTHVGVTALGVAVYWLIADRKASTAKRLVLLAASAGVAAAPSVWYFVTNMMLTGSGVSILQNRGLLDSWGPGIGDFFPLEVIVGLESNELAKISEPIGSLAWLTPIGSAMSALAPYLAYVVLAAAIAGTGWLQRRNPVSVVFLGSFVIWMAATRFVLEFPYGYFKLFGVAAPLLLGFAVAGASLIRQARWMDNSVAYGVWKQRALLLAGCLFALFLVRNSSDSFLFSARGWGISIPPSLVRGVADFGSSTTPSSRVYITGATRYPVPESRVVIRKNHRLGMQSQDETSELWSQRLHALVASSLTGRQIYGRFETEVWKPWSNLSPSVDYDYYVLTRDEDPRVFGLDSADSVTVAEGLVLYKSPGANRVDSSRLLAERGTLRVDDQLPLSFEAGTNRIGFYPLSGSPATMESGRIRVGLMALTETTVNVSAGGRQWSVLLDPGLSWYTTPTVSLPSPVKVEATGWNPVRVVSLREMLPGKEALERSNDSILSSETILDATGVSMDLWFSNPAKDGQGVRANIGIPGSGLEERTLALQPAAGASRLLLRFPLDGGKLQQSRNGEEAVPIEHFPWLERSRGILHLRFRRGQEKPLDIPLASATVDGGKITELIPFIDPVQVRLWGYDQRSARIAPPHPTTLEGSLVRADRPFIYAVTGGQRHWLPDSAAGNSTSEPRILTPEQLWLIPPGLPADR